MSMLTLLSGAPAATRGPKTADTAAVGTTDAFGAAMQDAVDSLETPGAPVATGDGRERSDSAQPEGVEAKISTTHAVGAAPVDAIAAILAGSEMPGTAVDAGGEGPARATQPALAQTPGGTVMEAAHPATTATRVASTTSPSPTNAAAAVVAPVAGDAASASTTPTAVPADPKLSAVAAAMPRIAGTGTAPRTTDAAAPAAAPTASTSTTPATGVSTAGAPTTGAPATAALPATVAGTMAATSAAAPDGTQAVTAEAPRPGNPASVATSVATPAPASTAEPVVSAPPAAPAPTPAATNAAAADQAAAPTATSVPAGVAPTQATAAPSAAASAPAAPAQTPVPQDFAAQLTRPIANLRTAGAGEHVVTVSVTPENLGPVTVRAHIGADGMRIELIAPSDAGREALKGILGDLRRDLAALGVNTPSLTAGGQQGQGQSGQQAASLDIAGDAQGDRRGASSGEREPRTPRAPAGELPTLPKTYSGLASAGIDILA
jgi:flagellar hook-length control protein FliK